MSVGYEPPHGYGLDVEVFTFADLRNRVTPEHLQQTQRLAFYFLALFTDGVCEHMVDFEKIGCQSGSLLLLRPGQVQRFAADFAHCDGYLLIFHSDFLQLETTSLATGELTAYHDLDGFQAHLALGADQTKAMVEGFSRMLLDASLPAPPADVQRLLRLQVLSSLARLRILHKGNADVLALPAVKRFRRYRHLVESEFARLHQVADYAAQLGYSEKSLNRAVKECAHTSAKAFLSKRIALEAKRLLANTDLPVAIVATKLGFDEATNFTKFFQREVGCSPRDFRLQHP